MGACLVVVFEFVKEVLVMHVELDVQRFVGRGRVSPNVSGRN